MSPGANEYATSVVRLSRAGGGRLVGVVERTGEKVRFHELGAGGAGAVIARMLARDVQLGRNLD